MPLSLAYSDPPPESLTLEEVKKHALQLGWDDMGITSCHISEENIRAYRDWLKEGFHGDLLYMENEIRCTPEKLLPGAKTAIIFVSYYKQEKLPFRKDAGMIASYARGRKYHNVHRRKLKKFILWLEERTKMKGIAKGFSDSVPLLEKALAVQAGLGWFGKNTLLIHRKFGTFTLLSGVLTTLSFREALNEPRLPRCGSCQRCIDACPTQAIVSPYRLDATKCLSYHLIESKKNIPKEIAEKNPGYLFGCDICQDVCPHNAKKPLSTNKDFSSAQGVGAYLTLPDIKELNQMPQKLYGSPLQRKGSLGLLNNAETLLREESK